MRFDHDKNDPGVERSHFSQEEMVSSATFTIVSASGR